MKKPIIALRIILIGMLVIPTLNTAILTITDKKAIIATDILPIKITISTVIAEAGGPYIGTKCESIVFIGSVTGGCSPYSWDWDFGDGSIHSNQQNITHQYVNDGFYTVILTVIDCVGVMDSDTASVTISTPILVADANGPYEGFTRIPINFYGSASGGCPRVGCKPYNYSWNFGDGGSSTKQNPSYTYASSGEYTVTLSVTDVKNDTSIDITSATILGSDLDVDVDGPYYGEVDVPILFYCYVESGVTPYSYHWDFGDGSTSEEQNPIYTYSDSSPSVGFKVSLFVVSSDDKNGWDQTRAYILDDMEEPTANAGGPYEEIVNEIIHFSGNAFGGASPYNYSWDFNDRNGIQDDSTEQNPTYVYEIPGIYNVTLIVTDNNGKTDYDITTATVLSLPDMECNGILSWIDVKPETPVNGSFTVRNIGEPESKLNWNVDSYPDWGVWDFSLMSGVNLTPADGIQTVGITLVAPDEKNADFTGQIKVVNTNNPDDFEIIKITLNTPKNKGINISFFLQKLIQRFSLFEKILNQII